MAFTAQYAGVCDACDEPIKPGQQIQDSTEAQRGAFPYEHVQCPQFGDTSGKPCPKCFLFHNGACF